MKQIELIIKKEFVTTALDLENEVFVVHVAIISQDQISIPFGELRWPY